MLRMTFVSAVVAIGTVGRGSACAQNDVKIGLIFR